MWDGTTGFNWLGASGWIPRVVASLSWASLRRPVLFADPDARRCADAESDRDAEQCHADVPGPELTGRDRSARKSEGALVSSGDCPGRHRAEDCVSPGWPRWVFNSNPLALDGDRPVRGVHCSTVCSPLARHHLRASLCRPERVSVVWGVYGRAVLELGSAVA